MDIPLKSIKTTPHSYRISVFALGGGAVNCLRTMNPPRNEQFKAYALDSDAQSIAPIPGVEVLHLQTRSTQGMSTAGDVEAGRRLIHENREMIAPLCASSDLVFIVAGFGGGTGTGGAAALAEIASAAGALILGFITLPFDFEGAARRRVAEEGLRPFLLQADAVVLIPNQRLLNIQSGNTSLQSAFGVVAEAVNQSIIGMANLINTPGVINLDFADIRRLVMNSQGACALSCATAQGPDRARDAVQQALDHPLFECRSVLQAAQSVIVGICGGPDLALRDIEQVMRDVAAAVGDTARMKMGVSLDPGLAGRLSLILLASDMPERPEEATAAAEPPEEPQGKGARRRRKYIQSKLTLDANGKGRFKDVEPTIRNGEDLDIPTFLRRGIVITGND